ncbi:angiopoietin-2-like [Anopheles aquasalis]|uniref:angiopoietin-2-like n=1 Tax=Anopheles aquasalis TaxID=42839 RepID=UPI00215AA720|nr:angiopoietin-2-like [Anopheles aquasalis]
MKHSSIGLILFGAVLYVAASDRGLTESKDDVQSLAYGTSGFGLELILAKLEAIEYRLQKMESMQLQLQKIEDKIQDHRSSQRQIVTTLQKHQSTQGQIVAALNQHRSSQEQSQKEILTVLNKLVNQVALNLSEDHNRDQEVNTALHKLNIDVDNVHNITQQIMNALPQVHQITEILQKQCPVSAKVDYNSVFTPTEVSVPQPPITPKTTTPTAATITTITTTPKPKQPPFSSCKDVPSNISGTYLIRVNRDSEPFEVYCEQKTFGGGWIVFQYRYDGSLDFYRGWNEFRDGFGDLNKEFWLGLEKVHQITSGRKHEFVVELKDFNGTYKYALFNAFEIGSESKQYNLKDIGAYNGTAGDEMSNYKGRKFSTKDRDNDEDSRHCAQDREGAWWHWRCTLANLNGRYMNAVNRKSMHWYFFNNNKKGLSFSRMMIREKEERF